MPTGSILATKVLTTFVGTAGTRIETASGMGTGKYTLVAAYF
jgi:hypothetical protein